MEDSLRIGCISWTYEDWLGSFYPEGTKPSEFLSLYSRVFNTVEVDSTFYRLPNSSTVKQWREKTPSDFLFSAKLPKRISHDSRLKDISVPLSQFEKTIQQLGPKLACVVVQTPPFFKFEKGIEPLKLFLEQTNPQIKYAFEFRDTSWFREETYHLLADRNASLAWSTNDRTENALSTPKVTSDFIYLRFMGKFGEFKKLDHVQKEKKDLLMKWYEHLSKVQDEVKQSFVLVSNHFEGFAPSTVNSFRTIAGMEGIDWEKRMIRQGEFG